MMNPKIAIPIIIVIAVLAGFFVYPQAARKVGFDFPSVSFNLGLDIKGGAHLVYQADVSQIPPDEQNEALSNLKGVIERRVNLFGVSEPVINTNQDKKRLMVELAGVLDVNEAIDLIGKTPYLEFREPIPEGEAEMLIEESGDSIELSSDDLFRPTELTGRFLQKASLAFDPNTSEPIVVIEFNDRGADLFADLTRQHIGQPVAIYLDGQILSAPIVQDEITGGQAQITGRFTVAEARELVRDLNAGALPVPIELVSQQTVGPTLGQESLQKSLVAGFIGFLLVILYMTIYYRAAGVVATSVLCIYAVAVLALFKLFSVTLTLAGIVGFILTIGIAVDANILVFERMKEEMARGRDFPGALEEGFNKAKTAIRDAYTSTLLTAAVLYWFGTSLVRGFALTLAIGLIVAFAVAFLVTRTFLRGVALTKLRNSNFAWKK